MLEKELGYESRRESFCQPGGVEDSYDLFVNKNDKDAGRDQLWEDVRRDAFYVDPQASMHVILKKH